MPIGNEDVAIEGHRDSGWPVEHVRPVPTHAWRADRHQYLAGRTDFEDLLTQSDAPGIPGGHAEDRLCVIGIGRPDVPVPVDRESVRVREESHPEASEKPSRWIELQNGRVGLAAIETGGVALRHIVETTVKNPNVPVGRRAL